MSAIPDATATAAPTTYIGDGVYASFDGFNIWLRTQSGNEIGLEPEVLAQLDTYRGVIDELYDVRRYAPKKSS